MWDPTVTVLSSVMILDLNGPIAIIRFNQPAARNPLSSATLKELETALRSLSNDLQTVIFTGAEDVFASGANIRELAQLDALAAARFSTFGQSVFQTIADLPQVTIAAINGYCIGGALDLALACDLRLASSNAVFAHPGAQLGIITGWGGTQRLPRLIGRTRALELLLTAKRVTSAEALQLGLVTGVNDPVLEHAIELARKLRFTGSA